MENPNIKQEPQEISKSDASNTRGVIIARGRKSAFTITKKEWSALKGEDVKPFNTRKTEEQTDPDYRSGDENRKGRGW